MKRLVFIIFAILGVSSMCIYAWNQRHIVKTKIVTLENKLLTPTSSPIPAPTQILSSGLPDYHLIRTVFVPQAPQKDWNEPWQDACEEASMLILRYYQTQQSPPIEQIVSDLNQQFSYENDHNWPNSINLSQMASLLNQMYDIDATIELNPTLGSIKQHLADDRLIIVPANGKTLFKENHHFKDGGPWYHNIVILGYDDKKQKFITHDVGTQFGPYYSYSYKIIMESMHDLPPSGKIDEIDAGNKSILVMIK